MYVSDTYSGKELFLPVMNRHHDVVTQCQQEDMMQNIRIAAAEEEGREANPISLFASLSLWPMSG